MCGVLLHSAAWTRQTSAPPDAASYGSRWVLISPASAGGVARALGPRAPVWSLARPASGPVWSRPKRPTDIRIECSAAACLCGLFRFRTLRHRLAQCCADTCHCGLLRGRRGQQLYTARYFCESRAELTNAWTLLLCSIVGFVACFVLVQGIEGNHEFKLPVKLDGDFKVN